MWSWRTRTPIVHTKWHVDPSSRLITIDMGQKVGGCCSLVTCLNCTVKIWTVINWTVITNRNPNRNRSPNPVLTVQISTIQISPGEFHCPEFDCPHIVRIPLHVMKCLHVGNRAYNSSHCMSGIQRAGRKNITSGTRRAVSYTKRREFLSFLPTNDLVPFSYTYPTKTLFETDKDQLIVAGIC